MFRCKRSEAGNKKESCKQKEGRGPGEGGERKGNIEEPKEKKRIQGEDKENEERKEGDTGRATTEVARASFSRENGKMNKEEREKGELSKESRVNEEEGKKAKERQGSESGGVKRKEEKRALRRQR